MSARYSGMVPHWVKWNTLKLFAAFLRIEDGHIKASMDPCLKWWIAELERPYLYSVNARDGFNHNAPLGLVKSRRLKINLVLTDLQIFQPCSLEWAIGCLVSTSRRQTNGVLSGSTLVVLCMMAYCYTLFWPAGLWAIRSCSTDSMVTIHHILVINNGCAVEFFKVL